MSEVAIALVGLIATFPMVIQVAVVFFILIGGLLFLGKSFLAVFNAGKGKKK